MLTKHEIAEYYSDPAVRRRILETVHGKPVLVVQNRKNRKVYRRNNPRGGPIDIQSATGNSNDINDLAWFTDRRFSEFHPVIGKTTDMLYVDIDPGTAVSTEEVKPIVNKVLSVVKDLPKVEKTDIVFSGGKGFHVRGHLSEPLSTDRARARVVKALKKNPIEGTVFSKPTGTQVRLDTSTLKNQGSLRAPYSINSDTGLVAVPLTERELRGFDPLQADVRTILRRKEFAPGVPRSRRIYGLPTDGKDRVWTLAVQEHNAKKAGKHWDLRLVDPDTGYAHSWAVPKSRLPDATDRPLLAVRTPTHTSNYALNFGDKGLREISKGYGKGTVEIKHKEPVSITKLKDNSLRFKRLTGDNKDVFSLFKTKDDNWLLRNVSNTTKEGECMTPFQRGYLKALVKLGVAEGVMPEMRANETDEPIETNDRGLPADLLANALSEIPDNMDQRSSAAHKHKPAGTSVVEERLNRPTTFGQTMQIPSSYMDGPTRMIPGAGFGGGY